MKLMAAVALIVRKPYPALAVAGILVTQIPGHAAEPTPATTQHASVSAEPSLETVLARHIGWLGTEDSLDRLRTISITGRIEVAGLSGTFRSLQDREGSQRSDYDLGVVKGSQGVGPDSAWVMDGSGRVEPMGTEEAKIARREIARSFGGNFRGTDGSSRVDLGTEERDGRSWRVIRFAYPDSDAYDLLIDPADGSNAWARERRDTKTIWHHFEDWRMQEGVRIPFRASDVYANPAENQTVTIERIEFNQVGLDRDLFNPPHAAEKLYSIAGGAAATDWMPMTLARGSYVFLHGSVNGFETDFLLDSGAGLTVLDAAFAVAQGIETSGHAVASGTVGQASASFATGITIRVGALELRNLTAAVIDLSSIENRLGRPLPVILGKEVFHSLIVDLDYPAGKIRFTEPDGYEYEGPGHRLAVQPAEDGHKEIEIAVEDLPPVRVGLDTGSGAALDLYGPYVEANHLLDGRARISEAFSGGVGGTVTEKVASLRKIAIAGYSIPDVPIGVVHTDIGAFATKRSAGNLGSGILKRFRVVFDYAHDCLWLEPRPGTESDSFDRNRSGLITDRKDGALEVQLVAPGSPAETAGWKVGERITGIDGTPVGSAYSDEIDRFALRAEGTEVRLTLADGSERRLTMARYY